MNPRPPKARSDKPQPSRRDFITRTAAGAIAAPWLIPASARGADGTTAPSDRITLGMIGNGMMGRGHLGRCVHDHNVHILAVCEVDRLRRTEAKQRVDQTYARRYAKPTYRATTACNDYRDVLARPDIDAVVIATPDHWHSLQSIHAAKAGKDVYCEKPISLNIGQGRALVDTITRYARVFQTGSQYRSMPTIRGVCNFVRNGGIGRVKAAFTKWSCLGAQFDRAPYPVSVPLAPEPVPDGLDWPLWVGPAPWRPYNHAFHRNPRPGVVPWAFCEDFGVAAVTWHYSHTADVVQYGLGVEQSGPVEIIHPSSGQFPTLTCRYANGTLLHHVAHWGQVKSLYHAVPDHARLHGNFGGIFVGERGWITSMYGGGPIQGGPFEIFNDLRLPSREVSGSNNHHANFFECIRTRRQPSSHAEIGHRSASLGHLAIIAYKLRRNLKWDPAKEQFLGDDAANRLCTRALREPWRM